MTAIELLLDTAARRELHHAIILHGPSRDTLRGLATDISKRLLCPDAICGGTCVSCSKVDRGVHPDLHMVAAADDRKMISVEQVREVVSSASLRPYESHMKVFVIDPADAMSTTAANALLKTLEEPTRETAFILLTRSADLLLPTIRSRSQAVYIGPAGGSQPIRGSSIQARRLSSETDLLGGDANAIEELTQETTRALARFAARRETAALLELAATYAGAEPVADRVLLLASVLRDLASLPPEEMLDPDSVRTIQERIPAASLLHAASATIRAAQRFKVNVDARMAIEQALLKLVNPAA